VCVRAFAPRFPTQLAAGTPEPRGVSASARASRVRAGLRARVDGVFLRLAGSSVLFLDRLSHTNRRVARRALDSALVLFFLFPCFDFEAIAHDALAPRHSNKMTPKRTLGNRG
jgi:hypothetical protein